MAAATAAAQPREPRSTVRKLDELTASQIAALDRERTIFILPVGMLEQHGPHLPIGADTLAVVYEANGAARRVAQDLAGWSIVMMPPVNYGQSGANRLGDQRYHPGTYSISQATLRSLIADIGGQLAENRFKWIFVTNGHGAPSHNIALNEACDFVDARDNTDADRASARSRIGGGTGVPDEARKLAGSPSTTVGGMSGDGVSAEHRILPDGCELRESVRQPDSNSHAPEAGVNAWMRPSAATSRKMPRLVFKQSGQVLAMMPAGESRARRARFVRATRSCSSPTASAKPSVRIRSYSAKNASSHTCTPRRRRAPEITLGLVDAVRTHAAGTKPSDDITVVTVRYAGAPA